MSGEPNEQANEGAETTETTEATKAPETGLFEYKEGDTTLRLTPDEVRERLDRASEKEKGADDKFRKAADHRKENLDQLTYYKEVVETMKRAIQNDPEALKMLPKYKELGISEEYMQAAMKDAKGETTPTPAIDDATQAKIDRADQAYWKAQADEIKGKVKGALDTDEVLGNIMSGRGLPEKLSNRVGDFANQVLTRRVQEAEARNLTWTANPQELKAIVQEVRGFVTDLGLVAREGEDGPHLTVADHPTMGRSPGGLSSGLHRSSKPIERPSSRKTAERGEYALSRMLELGQEVADE